MADGSEILARAAVLLVSPEGLSPSNLADVLRARLEEFSKTQPDRLNRNALHTMTLRDLQVTMASECLSVIEEVQSTLAPDSPFGTRDVARARTLVALIFRWGTSPLLQLVSVVWLSKSSPSRIIDLTENAEKYSLLTSLTRRLAALIFPDGVQGPLAQNIITSILINRHLSDIYRAGITLGWLPKSQSTASIPTVDDLRPLIMRLLATLSPSENILALGQVVSNDRSLPTHVRKTCSSLLTRQLLRPEGVRGLFAAMFGEGDNASDASLEKLQQVATLLTTPPSSADVEEYFNTVLPRVAALCSASEPGAYQRGAAFALSRALDAAPHKTLTEAITLRSLHAGFLTAKGAHISEAAPLSLALNHLTTFVTNGDPSPTLISRVLDPIVPALYNIYETLGSVKTSDPALKEVVKNLLLAWGKLVDLPRGINIVWSIVASGRPRERWLPGADGQLSLSIRDIQQEEKPSLILPSAANDEIDLNANILDLYPAPIPFAAMIRALSRQDMASEIFMQLLQAHHRAKTTLDGDPLLGLLYLQLIMAMQQQFEKDQPSMLLAHPDKLFDFITHTLQQIISTSRNPILPSPHDIPRGLEKLRVVEDDGESSGGDSDDDDPLSDAYSADDEMVETALSLLLSVLEAYKELPDNARSKLSQLADVIEHFTSHGSPSALPLAREARMAVTVHIASHDLSGGSSRSSPDDNIQAQYQKALTLLQDPLLPVRAHGIYLLRQIVSPESGRSSTIQALLPAILTIMLQAVQDPDSYMFLNATQGLAAMVDSHGKEVLVKLIREYTRSLDQQNLSWTEQELDVKLRIAEAFDAIIRRCGGTLGQYVDSFMAPLLQVVHMRHIPTTFKTSAVSLLATCATTQALALQRYTDDLLNSMFDLLQIEGSSPHKDDIGSMDSNPTSTNSKFPPLRRAAIQFITLLVRELTKMNYEGGTMRLDQTIITRGKVTLGYLASVDTDLVVQTMAREGKDTLEAFEKSMLGL